MEKVKNEHLEEVVGGLNINDLNADEVRALQGALGADGAVVCYDRRDSNNIGKLGRASIDIIRGLNDDIVAELVRQGRIDGVHMINGIRCVRRAFFAGASETLPDPGEPFGRRTGVTISGIPVMLRNWGVSFG